MQDKELKNQDLENKGLPMAAATEKTFTENPIPESPPLEALSPESVETLKANPGSSAVQKEEDTPPVYQADRRGGATDATGSKATEHKKEQPLPVSDYHTMSPEHLINELQRLVKPENIPVINKAVNAIKQAFDEKFRVLTERKKKEFIADGGQEEDFQYNTATKKQFDTLLAEYRKKRNEYHQQWEQTLNNNLQKRLAIIEQLKSLVATEEDINTTYKTFKELQKQWHHAGTIPNKNYNDVWHTYHHHIEIFYDFLQLNRELRDLDFKHNLEEKLKLIARAEALTHEADLPKALRELRILHKIWKEELGPVAKEQRETIWERFNKATKTIQQNKEEYFREMEKVYEKNLKTKEEIIASLKTLVNQVSNNHQGLQEQITQVDALREAFFKAGKVPQKVEKQTWKAFRDTIRKFNTHKNTFYKTLKKEQQENLEKKKALLARAHVLKDSDDWKKVTPEMKQIQSEWKKIGRIPKKETDTLWKAFTDACNHYFNRLHAEKNEDEKEEQQNLEKKYDCLERLKTFKLSGDREKDLTVIKKFVEEWKQYGNIPHAKRHIHSKFNKIIDALFQKTGIASQQAALLKYGNKIQKLTHTEDMQTLIKEQMFIKRKIEESTSEIRQLENNLEFFSNTSENNPLVKDVVTHIEEQKEVLETWKAKLKKLTILKNNLRQQTDKC